MRHPVAPQNAERINSFLLSLLKIQMRKPWATPFCWTEHTLFQKETWFFSGEISREGMHALDVHQRN